MNKELNVLASKPLPVDPSELIPSIESRIGKGIIWNGSLLAGKKVVFSAHNSDMHPILGWGATSGIKVKPVKISPDPRLIAAVDSSCITIADTEDGCVYAVRATTIFSHSGGPHNYLRIGPILIYINEENADELIPPGPQAKSFSRVILLEKPFAQRMIRESIERFIQLNLASTLTHSVVLIDGPLRASIFDAEESSLSKILATAEENCNRVVGISKSTGLKLLGRLSSTLISSQGSPIYADVDEFVKYLTKGVMGRVLLVKFTDYGHVLRVDMGNPSLEEPEKTLGSLFRSDSFSSGYPESLKLAHHLSVFSNHEDACIKSCIAKLGAVELPSEDLRNVILGRLGVRPS